MQNTERKHATISSEPNPEVAIASHAAHLIEDDDVVFLGSGPLCRMLADCRKNSRALFVTPDPCCALRLAAGGNRCFLLGGFLSPGSCTVTGAEALEELQRFHFTMAFLDCDGISIPFGCTVENPEIAFLQARASEQAQLTFVLAPQTRFETVAAKTMLPLLAVHLITDRLLYPHYRDYTRIREVLSEEAEKT